MRVSSSEKLPEVSRGIPVFAHDADAGLKQLLLVGQRLLRLGQLLGFLGDLDVEILDQLTGDGDLLHRDVDLLLQVFFFGRGVLNIVRQAVDLLLQLLFFLI